MSTAARQNYLAAEVLTATPQKLHLLLVEGAIRFAEKAQRHVREGSTVEAVEALIRAQEIVTQMTTAIDHQTDPPLAGRVAAIYLFIFRSLVEAGYSLDIAKIADALRVLEVERETWRAVCSQGGQIGQGSEGGPGSRSSQGQGEAADDATHTAVPAPTANSRPPMPRFDPSIGPIPPARFSIDA
jgi:flagellar biosynthetic protein FliS